MILLFGIGAAFTPIDTIVTRGKTKAKLFQSEVLRLEASSPSVYKFEALKN